MITRLAMLVIALVVVCTVSTPRSAEAARYFWQNVNDGKWDTSANWEDMDDPDDDPANDGYPDGVGDEAHFTLAYTQPHFVRIPAAGVTVGGVYFDSHAITISAAVGGHLRIQTDSAGGGVILRLNTAPGVAIDSFFVPIDLLSDLTIDVRYAEASMLFSSVIDNVGAFHNIEKVGLGTAIFRASNAYQGITNVLGGQLVLDAPNELAIKGNLEIGSGGVSGFAQVRIARPHQIADTSRVWIKSEGLLTVDVAERVGQVIVDDGFVEVRTAAGYFVPESLTLSGGTIESNSGGLIRLEHSGVTATSSAARPSVIYRSSGDGTFDLGTSSDFIRVDDGPSATYDLSIDIPITAQDSKAGIFKRGTGTLRFTGSNTYTGDTYVEAGKLWLEPVVGARTINGNVFIGFEAEAANVDVRAPGAIADNARIEIEGNGSLWVNASAPERVGSVSVSKSVVAVGNVTPGARLVTEQFLMNGALVKLFQEGTLEVMTRLRASAANDVPARIEDGTLVMGGNSAIEVLDSPGPIELHISSKILGDGTPALRKVGPGTAVFSGNNSYAGATILDAGGLVINGQQPNSAIVLNAGRLSGVGRTGSITAGTSLVAPGASTGRFSSGAIGFTPGTIFDIELNGTAAGAYDQLAVTGAVDLGGARLRVTVGAALPADGRWTLIDNDGNDPVAGTFEDLPEGQEITVGGRVYAITYRGGDGNDVVLGDPEEEPEPTTYTYYLAEGATGAFFDDDVLIANPNEAQAPVTLTFLREGGATVTVDRVIPARSRVTIHVDRLAGLEDVSASVKVESTDKLPLIVERSMFWDTNYYGGHTANAVAKPEKQWTFAEGSQGGFFDTYILIANANAAPVTVTFTFLRENDTPVVKTVDVDPFARKTIHTGAYAELDNRSFGIVVDATEPVIAERSMYFATVGPKLWSGGHVNTGTVAPSRSWFHAEGATGTFFNTFILLSNPQDSAAQVDVKFLLDTGEVITRPKTLEAKQRLTINPADEGDARLTGAALSTVVQSDVPIVSERSMYWEGDVKGKLGEGHNSSGIPEAGLRWGLAEGRTGGDRGFVTYILLANPSQTAARVRVSYLRESGAPIVKEYDVPATSRFNIDVKTEVPDLLNSSFGADIEVLNDVPIAVERSLYWNALGALWSGGTNALATPLAPAP